MLAKASTFAGRRWPAGTWFLPAAGSDSVRGRVARAGLTGSVVAVASGQSESGIDLGSENVAVIRSPRVAVVAGEGVSPTSYGALWFFLDRELGIQFDALPARDFASDDLARYDVIVLPDASARALGGKAGEDALKAWVERGGRLIAVAGGARLVAGFTEIKAREAVKVDSAADDRRRYLAGRAEREKQEWRQEVPGSILPLRLDPGHPLAWGAGVDGSAERSFALHQGTLVFEPSAEVETVAHFPAGLTRTAGVISSENLARLEEGAWLVTRRMGSGSVVLFADDPLFRLFWKSTQPMFVNALLLRSVR